MLSPSNPWNSKTGMSCYTKKDDVVGLVKFAGFEFLSSIMFRGSHWTRLLLRTLFWRLVQTTTKVSVLSSLVGYDHCCTRELKEDAEKQTWPGKERAVNEKKCWSCAKLENTMFYLGTDVKYASIYKATKWCTKGSCVVILWETDFGKLAF